MHCINDYITEYYNVTMLHHAFLKYDKKIILKEVNANVCFKTKVTLKIKELWQIHALKNA